ncbi:MAG TPA: toxin-antitoxin system HicB family antitoxin [Acidobacteriota bacterium]|nr:toxin-antitoxin system HicB family antitoxin [Acidobacteriota bacterium]
MINKEIDEGKTYYVAEIPDLPGCGAHGETIDNVMKSLYEARRLWIEGSYEKGLDIPEPVSEDEFSGKFLLRIPPKLHMELSKNAEKENMSLNQYIRNTLERNLNLETMLKRIESLERNVSENRKLYIKDKSKN